ncbi:nuclear transport factor 2 family protein [Patulibacter sp. SYSU D01012]|uniref:Rv0361 family membrane protein n=1 Tax=Patulibacter sp. SYSU D01012 TaxID=2817381 RepID=UPI001B309627|nr:nuclear transport factor 2 family protein [Patulibacter sp. SYSU D01012]
MIAARSRLALLAVSGTIAALGATGCASTAGSSASDDKEFQGEAARVANTVHDLDDAYADQQNDDTGAGNVCKTLLSKRLVAALSRDGGCEKNAARALDDADPIGMSVQDVQIQGDVATVQAKVKLAKDEERTDTLKLVREGNTWKYDGTTPGRPGAKSR